MEFGPAARRAFFRIWRTRGALPLADWSEPVAGINNNIKVIKGVAYRLRQGYGYRFQNIRAALSEPR